MTAANQQKREFFRVVYPKDSRPALIAKSESFEVLDISEGGIKLLVTTNPMFFVKGQSFKAVIKYADGSQDKLEGSVLRANAEIAVLKPKVNISLQRIMGEQRMLITKYGTLYEKV